MTTLQQYPDPLSDTDEYLIDYSDANEDTSEDYIPEGFDDTQNIETADSPWLDDDSPTPVQSGLPSQPLADDSQNESGFDLDTEEIPIDETQVEPDTDEIPVDETQVEPETNEIDTDVIELKDSEVALDPVWDEPAEALGATGDDDNASNSADYDESDYDNSSSDDYDDSDYDETETESTGDELTVSEASDEFGLANEFNEDPYSQKTTQKPSESGVVRVMAVGFGVVLTLLALGLMAHAMDLKSLLKKDQIAEEAETQVDESADFKEDKAISLDNHAGAIALADQDVGTATADQKLEAKRLEKQINDRRQAGLTPTNATESNTVTVTPSATPTPTPRAYTPPTPGRTRAISTRAIATPKTRPITSAVPRTSPAPIASPAPTKEKANPYELYAQLSQSGSFGGTPAPASNGPSSSANPLPTEPASNETIMSPNESLKIQLETPLVWPGDNSKKGVAVVTEGTSIIPKGTLVAVAIMSEDSKAVDMGITHFYIDDEARPVTGNLRATDKKNKPLQAKKKGGKGGSIIPTIGKALLGALGKGTGLLNQPDSITSTASTFSSSTTQSGDQNFILGALQGVSETLLGDIKDRNQAAIDRQETEDFYMVPAGIEITLTAIEPLKG